MIQITPQMRILVAVEPVDFRCGIDRLAGICRQKLLEDPFSGTVFVFCNRTRSAVKLLIYDGQGFWLCQKRLSQGRFLWWPKSAGEATNPLAAHELQLLLWNGDPANAQVAPLWKALPPSRK